MSRWRLRNHVGILYCVGFWMMVTMRSSSSEVISPALKTYDQYNGISRLEGILRVTEGVRRAYRLFKSTSAFLQTRLEYRRPTPLILVKAYMIFCFPSTFVLRSRRMNWKFDFSPVTSAIRTRSAMSSPMGEEQPPSYEGPWAYIHMMGVAMQNRY